MFKPIRKDIPTNPGVYIFKDKFQNIIYIGKAKNLRNRVSSYFSLKHENSPKTRFLVKNISDVEFIIVDNEIESLLLENKLIKKNKPKYNINLKDNKTYAFIKITNEKIPKIISTRKVTKTGTYFGPYTSGSARREIIELIIDLFHIITPKTYRNKSHLYYEIGKAPAKTPDEIDLVKYKENIELAKDFLKGKNINKTLKQLKIEMDDFSSTLKFELALKRKTQIDAILHMLEKQKVDLKKNYDQDVLVIIKKSSNALIQVLNISKGIITSKKDFRFELDEELFVSFIKMYYSTNYIPNEIMVNYKFWENDEEKELIEEYLQKLRGSKVNILFPQKGEKLALIKLAEKNAKILMKNNVLSIIKEKLNLPQIPNIIECFDMSNLGKEYLVGAMTRWVNGQSDKEGYRKFEIKSFKGKNDDYLAMKEVVYRRYRRLKDEKKELPNLIIIDGGKGQLKFAVKSLRELNLKIPILSIAKGSKRDKNEIFLIGNEEPLIFDDNSQMMLFLRKVRDSVHNLVINYNRKKRDMKFDESLN